MTQLAGKSPVADYENQLRSSGLVGLGGGKGVLGQRYVFRKRGSLIGQLKKNAEEVLVTLPGTFSTQYYRGDLKVNFVLTSRFLENCSFQR